MTYYDVRMSDIQTFMTGHHRHCDEAFVEFENSIVGGDWSQLKRSWETFAARLIHHFDMEECILFTALESATGMIDGPTTVMRSEHQLMRNLVAEIERAIENQDQEQCQGTADTLMIMMQQHNRKEEQMLYPMADQQVDAAEIIASMQSTGD